MPFWPWVKVALVPFAVISPLVGFLSEGTAFIDDCLRRIVVVAVLYVIACIKTRKKPPKKRKAKKEKTSLSRPALNGSFVPVGA
jgi:hypothetical protein